MTGQIGRLIDNGIAQPTLRQDLARAVAPPAGIEIVAMEIEHHDAGALDPLQERIELGRVEPPAVVEIVKIAIGRRRGRDHRIDIGGGVGRHQRQKRAEGLPGEDDLLVTLVLELGCIVDKARGAVAQRVAAAQPIETHHLPAIVAQGMEIGRGRRLRIFGVDRAAVAPHDDTLGLAGAESRPGKCRVEPERQGRSGSHQHGGQHRSREKIGQYSIHLRHAPPVPYAYG